MYSFLFALFIPGRIFLATDLVSAARLIRLVQIYAEKEEGENLMQGLSYTWDFTTVFSFVNLWWGGVLVTLQLSALVIVGGTLLGVVAVFGLKSRNVVVRFVTRVFVDVFRAIPALVLMGTMYFCLPMITGVRIDSFQTAVLALTLNLCPFAAECIRAGVESVPASQYETASVLGLSRWQTNRYIVLPQAMRRILPSFMGQCVTSLKLTSLAATIGVTEIWHATSSVISATSLPLEARLVGAGLYTAIILPPLWISLWFESYFHVRGLGLNQER
ncbi:MAG: amino acid ABC transporter permease [Patescibacteria group bacterium]